MSIRRLLKYDFLVLYPIHPRLLAKFREAFAPSGAKDDPTDAQLALELLRKHRDKLRRWRPADESTRTLQLLVEQRRKLVNDKTRLLNRLTSTLKGYFPQILTWFQPLDTRLVYAFLQQWPTLEAVQQADDHTLLQFFRIYYSKRQSLNERRLAAIRQAIPATTDRAVVTVSVMSCRPSSSRSAVSWRPSAALTGRSTRSRAPMWTWRSSPPSQEPDGCMPRA